MSDHENRERAVDSEESRESEMLDQPEPPDQSVEIDRQPVPPLDEYHTYVQQVSITHAGFWLRLIAFLLDAVALYSLNIIVRLLAGQSVDQPNFGFAMFEFAYMIAYFVAMTTVFGQTLGKMVMGIQVVRSEDSDRSDGSMLSTIIYREFVGKFLSLLPLGFGFLMSGWSRDKRALHDMVADTKVIMMTEREMEHERASAQ